MKPRSWKSMKLPRKGSIIAIDGRRRKFTIVDEIVHEQPIPERSSRKVICLQKIQFEDDGRTEYRFTYYMLGVKPHAKGQWVFGQYSLLIPSTILRMLLKEARRRNWDGF